MPGGAAWTALKAAVVREGPGMKPQELSNTVWAYATLGLELGAKARAVMDVAVVRVAPDMNAQDTANTLWSVATLGLMPGAAVWAALEVAAARVASDINAQNVANTLWSVLALAHDNIRMPPSSTHAVGGGTDQGDPHQGSRRAEAAEAADDVGAAATETAAVGRSCLAARRQRSLQDGGEE